MAAVLPCILLPVTFPASCHNVELDALVGGASVGAFRIHIRIEADFECSTQGVGLQENVEEIFVEEIFVKLVGWC